MRKRITWCVLFACAAMLVLGGVVQGQAIFDPAWMKTTNQAGASSSARGLPAKPINDLYWSWADIVWDGPATNGSGVSIPDYVDGDFWAKWEFGFHGDTSKASQQWFKTTLDLPACTALLLDEVRLVNKYNPPEGQILSINDDLFVWVNGTAGWAGGNASAGNLHSTWTGKFTPSTQSGPDSVATDYWWIPNGIVLPKELFQAGPNQINVLTDDIASWGGMVHLVFKVKQTGPCAAGIDIKPGSYPNCFNVNGNGVIPVAILGSATFDVNQIDRSKLLFAGLAVRVKGSGAPQCSVQDVNADGVADMVCQFLDNPATWSGGATTATLTGNLSNGTPFAGTDEICIVP